MVYNEGFVYFCGVWVLVGCCCDGVVGDLVVVVFCDFDEYVVFGVVEFVICFCIGFFDGVGFCWEVGCV